MKRYFVFLIAVLMLVLAACSGSDNKEDELNIEKAIVQDFMVSTIPKYAETLILKGVRMPDYSIEDVWVPVNMVEVKIDSEAEGTLISAMPSNAVKQIGYKIFYDASSVIIWVQNTTEKQAWEKYLERFKIVPKKVVPSL